MKQYLVKERMILWDGCFRFEQRGNCKQLKVSDNKGGLFLHGF